MNLNDLFSQSSQYCYLAGAGISFDSPSNLPLAKNIVQNIVASLELEKNIEQELLGDFYKGRLRFEQFMELVVSFYDPELRILNHLSMCHSPNSIHNFLACSLDREDSVFTTNFDSLIELACVQRGITVRTIYKSTQEISEGSGTAQQVWKLHGSLQDQNGNDTRDSIVATLSRVGQKGEAFSSDPYLRGVFEDKVKSQDLVVLGYSGLDDYDVMPMISNVRSDRKIIWIWHDPDVYQTVAYEYKECPKQFRDIHRLFDEILSMGNWCRKQLVVVIGRSSDIVSELNGILTDNQNLKPKNGAYQIPGHYYSRWRIACALEDWRKAAFVGKYYLSVGDYKAAYHYFSLALDKTLKTQELLMILRILMCLSEICIRSGNIKRAMEHLKVYYALLHEPHANAKSEFLRELAVRSKDFLIDYYQHVAMCHTEMESYGEALDALDNSPTEENTSAHARKLYEMGRILARKGDFTSATQMVKQAICIHREHGNLNSLAICLLFFSRAHIVNENPEEAAVCLEEVARLCKLTNNSHIGHNCEEMQKHLQVRSKGGRL